MAEININPEDRTRYTGNARPRHEPIKPIVEGVTIGQKSTSERILSTFFSDSLTSLKDYLIFDVLLPSARDFLAQTGKNAIDALFYGKDPKKRPGPYNYGAHYQSSTTYPRTSYSRLETRDNIIEKSLRFNTAEDAYIVLDKMEELCELYGQVSVADMCDLVGVETSFADHRYGWKSLQNAYVTKDRNGWTLDLPRTRVID